MKKLLALLLAALTILPMIVACQKTTEQPAVTTDSSTTAPEETQDPFYTGVPKQDFKEWEFTIMCPWPDHWGKDSYNVDEDNGDSIVSAIYTRNRHLEDHFNIKITSRTDGYTHNQFTQLQPFVLAGTDVIDMVAVGFYQSGRSMITMDLVKPWNNMPYIDLEKPWWNKGVTDTLAILGNYYYLVGDVNWFYMPETAVCYFNKIVAEENKAIVGDLYQTVRDGKWTLDYMINMAKQFSRDNGDGVWDDQDYYGAIQNSTCGSVGFFYASEFETCVMQDDGPVFNISTKKMNTFMNKVGHFYNAANHYSYVDNFDFSGDSKGIPIFFDNRALFYFDLLIHAQDFRDQKSDYGFIPYPQFNEAQKNYSTFTNQWSLSCAMPVTASDPNRTGSILEEMSALSRKLIVPAYYEKTLMGKVKRDEESEEMLNMIFQNILYDFGVCYGIGSLPNATLTSGGLNLTFWWRQNEKKAWTNAWELYSHVYQSIHGVEPEQPERSPVK